MAQRRRGDHHEEQDDQPAGDDGLLGPRLWLQTAGLRFGTSPDHLSTTAIGGHDLFGLVGDEHVSNHLVPPYLEELRQITQALTTMATASRPKGHSTTGLGSTGWCPCSWQHARSHRRTFADGSAGGVASSVNLASSNELKITKNLPVVHHLLDQLQVSLRCWVGALAMSAIVCRASCG